MKEELRHVGFKAPEGFRQVRRYVTNGEVHQEFRPIHREGSTQINRETQQTTQRKEE